MSGGAWAGIEVRRDGAAAVVAWPDGTAMVLPGRHDDRREPPTGRAEAGDAGLEFASRLRRVADDVRGAIGMMPTSVTVVVPNSWDARQTPALRAAASAAGLGSVAVMPHAVGVGWHLLAGGVPLRPGAAVVICEPGPDCTATVVRRTGDGFEVASTVDATTTAAGIAGATGFVAGTQLTVLREVVQRAVRGAQLGPGAVDLVCVVGQADDPAVRLVLAEVCGVEPMLVAEPVTAAVLGAVQTGPVVVAAPAAQRVGFGQVAAVVVPAVWSVALFAQFMAGAVRYGPREKLEPGMLLAPWGGLAFAAVLGVVAVVGGALLGATVRQDAADEAGAAAGVAWLRHRLQAVALAGGALAGLGLAAVYALLAGSYFDLDLGPLLRWSVLPVLPLVVAVTGVAVLVWREPGPPGGSWSMWLRFPVVPVLVAGVGALLVSFDESGSPWVLQPLAWLLQQWAPSGATIIGPVGRVGGACIGVAMALLLARRPVRRVGGGTLLALLLGGVLAWRVTGAVAVGFALVVAAWWAARAVILLVRPRLLRPPGPPPPPPAGLAAGAGGWPPPADAARPARPDTGWGAAPGAAGGWGGGEAGR